MSSLHARAELTGWLLVSESLSQLPTRPWALELALRRLHETASFPVLTEWASETAFGWTFPKLSEVVWQLVDDGALRPFAESGRSVYLVNESWQTSTRQSLSGGSTKILELVTEISDYLASLAATPTSV